MMSRRFLVIGAILLFSLDAAAQSEGLRMYEKVKAEYEAFYRDFTTGNAIVLGKEWLETGLQLHDEGLDSLSSEALVKGAQLINWDLDGAYLFFDTARLIARKKNPAAQLSAILGMSVIDSQRGDPHAAWEKARKYEKRIRAQKDPAARMEHLHALALVAGMAHEMPESFRLFELIRREKPGKDVFCLSRKADAMGDYGAALVGYGLSEQATVLMNELNELMDELMEMGIPFSIGRFAYNFGVYCAHLTPSLADYPSAINFFENAIDFYTLAYDDSNVELIHAHKQLAFALSMDKQFARAYEELDKTISLARTIYGAANRELVNAFLFYSQTLLAEIRLDEAAEMAKACVKMLDATHGEDLEPEMLLSGIEYLRRDLPASYAVAQSLYARCEHYLRRGLLALPEKERELFWYRTGAPLMQAVINPAAETDDSAGLVYNAVLFSKGILMNVSTEISSIIEKDESGKLAQLRDRYKSLYYRAGALSNGDEAQQKEAESLREEARRLEMQLMAASRKLGDALAGVSVRWDAVSAALSEGEVALEFVRYEKYIGGTSYLASVLQPGKAPVNVPLPGLTDVFLAAQAGGDAYRSDALYKQLIVPLEPLLKGVKTIWFSPSGALSSIAIEHIRVPGGKYLSDQYTLHRLSSTRELAFRRGDEPMASAALFGGLDYNLSAEEMEYYAEEAASQSRSGLASAKNWNYLIGTLDEVKTISPMLSPLPVEVITRGEGVEQRFRALSGKGISLIHIATHGYYVDDIYNMVGGLSSSDLENAAMKTCGLVFAGANNHFPEGGAVGDGLVSAAEIATMDLSGCSLVVLSACGTGLSIVNFDESYGLMRAFKKAGCGSILMSLWDVDDAVTRQLMENFYRFLMAGEGKSESLQKAKMQIRAQHPDPKYWAGFVLID